MRTFSCGGTLGDAYIGVCYLYDMAQKEQIQVNHCPGPHTYWNDKIIEIYSLLPRVTVKIVPAIDTHSPHCWTYVHEKAGKFTQLPMFPVPRYPGLPDDYVVFAPRSGKPKESKGRVIHIDEAIRQVSAQSLPVVMLGDGLDGAGNVIDLRGKTSIKEALGVIAHSKRFIGFQGLLAYMALSHKVSSRVYTQSEGEYLAFRRRFMRQWVQYCEGVFDKNGR